MPCWLSRPPDISAVMHPPTAGVPRPHALAGGREAAQIEQPGPRSVELLKMLEERLPAWKNADSCSPSGRAG